MKEKDEYVDFKIEDEPQVYRLVFDFNELAEAEQVTGLNLMESLGNGGAMTAGQCRGLLYALLKTANPGVLLREAGDLLTRDLKTVTSAVAAAMGRGETVPEQIVDLAETEITPNAGDNHKQ